MADRNFRADHGRAWLVLLASFLVGCLTLGNALTLGVLFERIKLLSISSTDSNVDGTVSERGSSTNASLINLVFALNVAFTFLTGAIAAAVTAKIGYRLTMLIGAIMAMSGFALASLATQLWHLYLTLGVLAGFGFGLLYTPSVGILAVLFDKYRHFAATVASTGVSIGIMTYAYVHNFLSSNFSWSNTMLTEAVICSQLLLCACIMFNPFDDNDINKRKSHSASKKMLIASNGIETPNPQQIDAENDNLLLSDRRNGSSRQPPITIVRDFEHEIAARVERYIDEGEDSNDLNGGNIVRQYSSSGGTRDAVLLANSDPAVAMQNKQQQNLFHFEMFRDVKFYFLLLECLAIISVNIFLVITPAYLTQSHGWSTAAAAFVLSIHGAASLICRLCINLLNAVPAVGERIPKPLQVGFGILCIAVAALAYMLMVPNENFDNDVRMPLLTSTTTERSTNITTPFSWESARQRLEAAEMSLPDRNSRLIIDSNNSNMLMFFIFAAVNGVGEAFFISYQASLLMNIMGAHRLTTAFGYLNFVWGVATLALYPVAGMIGDMFGTLRYAYALGVACCALSFLSLLVVVVLHGRTTMRQRRGRRSNRAKTPSEISTVVK